MLIQLSCVHAGNIDTVEGVGRKIFNWLGQLKLGLKLANYKRVRVVEDELQVSDTFAMNFCRFCWFYQWGSFSVLSLNVFLSGKIERTPGSTDCRTSGCKRGSECIREGVVYVCKKGKYFCSLTVGVAYLFVAERWSFQLKLPLWHCMRYYAPNEFVAHYKIRKYFPNHKLKIYNNGAQCDGKLNFLY